MAAAGLRLRVDQRLRGCSSSPAPSGSSARAATRSGPFLSIEQAALSHVVTDRTRTDVFAWYTLAGSFATALGALAGGAITQRCCSRRRWRRSAATVRSWCSTPRWAWCWRCCSCAVAGRRGGDARRDDGARGTVAGLSGSIDRAVVLQAGRACSRSTRSAAASSSRASPPTGSTCGSASSPATLGAIFFWANVLAGISALLASRLAARIRAAQDDGRHAPAIQHPADSGAADADPAAGRCRAARAVQHQPDGRADAAVLRDGRGQSRRAIGGGRHHRRRAHLGAAISPLVRRLACSPARR